MFLLLIVAAAVCLFVMLVFVGVPVLLAAVVCGGWGVVATVACAVVVGGNVKPCPRPPGDEDEDCEHDWEYLEREPGETYTGYCERCAKCGEIAQVVQ